MFIERLFETQEGKKKLAEYIGKKYDHQGVIVLNYLPFNGMLQVTYNFLPERNYGNSPILDENCAYLSDGISGRILGPTDLITFLYSIFGEEYKTWFKSEMSKLFQ